MKRLATALLACLLSTQTLALTDEESKSAISNFYTQYVFGDKFLEKNSKLGTKGFLKKLQDYYEYDCEDVCYATYTLRTTAQDGNEESQIVDISPKGNGWYRVEYQDMGWKGITDVKVIEANGVVKLEDFKSIFDGATQ
jgi:hypothetical protein